MRKLKRTEVLQFKRSLHEKQGGLCLLCGGALGTDMSKVALDHNHITGECRGLLHLGCNKVEGSVFNTVARWGGVGKDYAKALRVLRNLITYLESSGTGVIYHLHKTEEEKREERNRKAREARARVKAKAAYIASKG